MNMRKDLLKPISEEVSNVKFYGLTYDKLDSLISMSTTCRCTIVKMKCNSTKLLTFELDILYV